MENRKNTSTNDRKSFKKRNSTYSSKSNLDSQEAKDGINYDYDWNTDYGDGDIPDIDEP